jgi:hypothetical protein
VLLNHSEVIIDGDSTELVLAECCLIFLAAVDHKFDVVFNDLFVISRVDGHESDLDRHNIWLWSSGIVAEAWENVFNEVLLRHRDTEIELICGHV